MSDDLGTEEDTGSRDTDAVRDDIMKRLLDYQRAQRGEGETVSSVWATPPVRAPQAPAEPERTAEATAAEPTPSEQPEPIVDAPGEPVLQPPTPQQPAPDAQARIDSLHTALEGVRSQIEDLRQTFQDMAIAADERLAEIEEQIARARGSNEPS